MKKFLIIGNNNAITYKEVFPLIKNNQMWLGVRSATGGMWFDIVDEASCGTKKVVDGKLLGNTNSVWFTNLDHKKRHEKLDLYKKYTPEEYPKYDNYDAINVDKVCDIPLDYDGAIGVPVSFVDKFCPERLEIIDKLNYPIINGKAIYKRLIIKLKK